MGLKVRGSRFTILRMCPDLTAAYSKRRRELIGIMSVPTGVRSRSLGEQCREGILFDVVGSEGVDDFLFMRLLGHGRLQASLCLEATSS